MASAEAPQPKLRAAVILSLSDTDFDRAMREIIPAGRTEPTYIAMRDLTELPKSEQLRVMQRIKNWVHSPKSCPVDLDQVNARLLEACATPASPQPSRQRSWVPTPENYEELNHEFCLREEVEAYDDLVADGGRPWYPFRLLERVSRNPGENHDMLRFWCSDDDWLVYTKQWERWRNFRAWQRDNRGSLDFQAEFEKEKAEALRYHEKYMGDTTEIDTEEHWARRYEVTRRRRGWQHALNVEDGVKGKDGEARFPAYVLALQARLDRHGFARAIQLQKDHQKQDHLTTWIEYLNYEYWVRDKFAEKATRLRPRYEESLRELLDANVLLPGETVESVCEFYHGFKLESEKRAANEAVKAAEAAVSAAEKSLGGMESAAHHPGQEAALSRARERLKRAVNAASAAEKRSELTYKFQSIHDPYSAAQQKADNHDILLGWILDQIPLIEAEMAGQGGEGQWDTRSAAKRAKDDGGELDEERLNAERRKPDAQSTQAALPSPEPEPPVQFAAQPNRKRARANDGEEERELPGLKRQKADTQPLPVGRA